MVKNLRENSCNVWMTAALSIVPYSGQSIWFELRTFQVSIKVRKASQKVWTKFKIFPD